MSLWDKAKSLFTDEEEQTRAPAEEAVVDVAPAPAPVVMDAPKQEKTVENTYGDLIKPRQTQHQAHQIDINDLINQVNSPEAQKAQEAERKALADRFQNLQDEHKKLTAEAQARQFKAEAIAAIGNYLPKAIAGATAVNTKANVQAPNLAHIEVGDLTAPIREKYKTDYEKLNDQYKALMKGKGGDLDIKTVANLAIANQNSKNTSDRLNANRETVDRQLTKGVGKDILSEQKGDELTDKQADDAAEFQANLSEINGLHSRADSFKDKLGPIAGKYEATKEGQGGLISAAVGAGIRAVDPIDKEYVAFKSDTKAATAAYKKLITGVSSSPKEAAELESIIPNPNDTYEAYKPKAAAFERRVRELYTKKMAAAKNLQGKNVAGYTDTAAKVVPPAGADPAFEAKMQAAMKANPNATREQIEAALKARK